MEMKMGMKIRFKYAEDKKWSHKYHEINKDGRDIADDWKDNAVGALYIKKNSELGKITPPPKIIEVEFSVVEG
jgi:hypothetical protein